MLSVRFVILAEVIIRVLCLASRQGLGCDDVLANRVFL